MALPDLKRITALSSDFVGVQCTEGDAVLHEQLWMLASLQTLHSSCGRVFNDEVLCVLSGCSHLRNLEIQLEMQPTITHLEEHARIVPQCTNLAHHQIHFNIIWDDCLEVCGQDTGGVSTEKEWDEMGRLRYMREVTSKLAKACANVPEAKVDWSES
eukprot:1984332-Rhodomonas_salina.3